MSRKKKREKVKAAAYMEWVKNKVAGDIKDRFSHVKSIMFDISYKDHDWHADPSPTTLTKNPDSYALFKFECPYWECVNGGHDLTEPVTEMLSNRQSECSGKITCQGWQDKERIGKYRCLLELNYKAIAEYD